MPAPTSATEALRLIAVLNEFRKLDKDIPVQTVLTFLTIAAQPGLGGRELAKELDISESAASRNLNALTQLNRFKEPGFDVITYGPDIVVDSRKSVANLNANGQRLLKRVLNHL